MMTYENHKLCNLNDINRTDLPTLKKPIVFDDITYIEYKDEKISNGILFNMNEANGKTSTHKLIGFARNLHFVNDDLFGDVLIYDSQPYSTKWRGTVDDICILPIDDNDSSKIAKLIVY